MTAVEAPARLPDFLVVGAMRCGTTALWDLLGRHEGVFLPARKELHFFDDRGGAFARGAAAYAAAFAGAPEGALCGECSPSYLFVPGTAERIHAVVPDVRLVAIVRDPVERAWSHYWFNVRRGRERLPFERALEREAERTAGATAEHRRWFAYVARGRYLEQLRRYEAVFGRGRICVVVFEDLRRDPQTALAPVLAHLGLPPAEIDARVEGAAVNRGSYPRSLRLHVAAEALRRRASTGPAPVREAARAAAAAVRRVNLTGEQPRMAEATRRRLVGTFADDNRALAAWLGRPLPWPRPGAAA